MKSARHNLEAQLTELPDVTVGHYKDTDLMCVSYHGKEFAHFHDQQEIDIRLPKKFVRQEALGPPIQSAFHPDRSPNSIWRVLQFRSEADVDALVALVQALLKFEYDDLV